jgi:transposase
VGDHRAAPTGGRGQEERPSPARRPQGPERYGPYTTAYNRFNRWAKKGIWLTIFEALAARSPQSLHLIDSSIVRAHQHAAGGKKGARITPPAILVED